VPFDPNDERLTMSEVARLLGVHLATAWRWAQKGVRGRRLPTFCIGARRWVSKKSLLEFLDAGSELQAPRVADERHVEMVENELKKLL
jgi:hypothetical protein